MDFSELSAPEILKTLGTRLRERRLVEDMTQADLATKAEISVGALRGLEQDGHSSLLTLVRVVKALGLEDELEPVFEAHINSIADLKRLEKAEGRRRASGRRTDGDS